MKTIAVILGCALLVGGTPHFGDDDVVTLTVSIESIRNAGGTVAVALFDESEASAFPEGDPARTMSALASSTGVELVFEDLAPGRYALAVIHDENENGVMDTNEYGIPVEGFGFSNNVMGEMGPPSFEQASVDTSDDASTSVRLIYMGND